MLILFYFKKIKKKSLKFQEKSGDTTEGGRDYLNPCGARVVDCRDANGGKDETVSRSFAADIGLAYDRSRGQPRLNCLDRNPLCSVGRLMHWTKSLRRSYLYQH